MEGYGLVKNMFSFFIRWFILFYYLFFIRYDLFFFLVMCDELVVICVDLNLYIKELVLGKENEELEK